MRDRTTLELQGIIYEGMVGGLLRDKRKDGVVIYNKRLKCNFLPHGETQVDIIFVTSKAVFVIEVKDWRYRIEGGYNDYEWLGIGKSLWIPCRIFPKKGIWKVRTLPTKFRLPCVCLPRRL